MRLTTEKQIPQKMQICAHVHQLGVPRIMYESHKESRLHLVLGPLAILIALLILVIYRLYYDQIFSWWPTWQSWIVPEIGLAWLLISVWILLTPIFSPHLRLYLCPKGLIYARRGLEVIRWDQIALIYKELDEAERGVPALNNYTLVREDGKRFVLPSDLPYMDRLGGFMEREVVRYLLPTAITAFENGLIQSFGVFLLDKYGLKWQNTPLDTNPKYVAPTLPWPQCERIVLEDATLSIYRRGARQAWATLSVSGVPNLRVFQDLVAYITKNMHMGIHTDIHAQMPVAQPPIVSAKPARYQAYDAGSMISFGGLSMSKNGVRMNNGKELVPWEEIASFAIGESEVILKRIGTVDQWYTQPLWTISDIPELKQLIDYVLYQQYLS